MEEQSLKRPIIQSNSPKQFISSSYSSSSIIKLLPPPDYKSKKSRNNILYSPPHQFSNRKDEDPNEDQRLSLTDIGNGHKTLAKKTIKKCIDLLFPSRYPYTIVASGQSSASVLLIR
ncbi:MAG: hypothetical protein EZS28_036601, partial [Streblomastix strix]